MRRRAAAPAARSRVGTARTNGHKNLKRIAVEKMPPFECMKRCFVSVNGCARVCSRGVAVVCVYGVGVA
jgi:hypothetical protein